MADRENVIKALEICSQDVFGRMCINCTYESDYHRHCHEILMGDTLELLKDQPDIVRCKDCVNRHNPINCRMYSEGMDTPEGWFCADGERR